MFSLHKFFLPLFWLLFFTKSYSQAELVFDKSLLQCENKWVVFNKNEAGKYNYGFIYIDQMAGPTLEHEGWFTINEQGRYMAYRFRDSLNAASKIRLKPSGIKVSLLPSSHFKDLTVEEVPGWLHIYQSYTDTTARLQRWGYFYNAFGESERALAFLEAGYQRDSKYKDMAVELGFAYNATERYYKAIEVLLKAAELEPTNGYIYKELSFAYLNTDNLAEAEKVAYKGIGHYKSDNMKAEMAYNVAYQYYLNKDKTNFSKWAQETRKWCKKGDRVDNTLAAIEKRMNE